MFDTISVAKTQRSCFRLLSHHPLLECCTEQPCGYCGLFIPLLWGCRFFSGFSFLNASYSAWKLTCLLLVDGIMIIWKLPSLCSEYYAQKNYTKVYRLFTTPTTPWCGQPATSFIYNLQNIEFGISVRSPCFQYYKVKNKPKHNKFQGRSPHKVSLVYI